jgi:hypothetical protein
LRERERERERERGREGERVLRKELGHKTPTMEDDSRV